MSKMQSDGSTEDQAPLLLERRFSTDLQLDCNLRPEAETFHPSQGPVPRGEPPRLLREPKEVVLSTRSQAALKLGTQQLIPRNLAVTSRTKTRHHTTVVTMPVAQVPDEDGRAAKGPEVSWEDYDSDGEGVSIRRNRRNKSYRSAITSLDSRAVPASKGTTRLAALSEEEAPTPQPEASSRPVASAGPGKASTNPHSCGDAHESWFCVWRRRSHSFTLLSVSFLSPHQGQT